jgi:hypothetical protein
MAAQPKSNLQAWEEHSVTGKSHKSLTDNFAHKLLQHTAKKFLVGKEER